MRKFFENKTAFITRYGAAELAADDALQASLLLNCR